jgi:hypothetical protein
MPASDARIRANQRNAAHSTGPRTAEGKAVSRGNALKHGLTGEGIALSNEDAVEVERRFVAFQAEMKPSGELGRALVQRVAMLSVRLDRSVTQETAALSDRVRQAEADFEAPEGLDDESAEQLRREAGRRAMFDPSQEATLARKYEAAAERGFFRALKEFRQVERESKGPEAGAALKALGSFLPVEKIESILQNLPATSPRPAPSKPAKALEPAWNPAPAGVFDVPFAIGRAR